MFYWDQSFVVDWSFSYSIWENHFSVGLLARLFQLAKQVAVIMPRDCKSFIMTTISRGCSDSTETGWKSDIIEKRHPYQPKVVVVETVDSNRIRP